MDGIFGVYSFKQIVQVLIRPLLMDFTRDKISHKCVIGELSICTTEIIQIYQTG